MFSLFNLRYLRTWIFVTVLVTVIIFQVFVLWKYQLVQQPNLEEYGPARLIQQVMGQNEEPVTTPKEKKNKKILLYTHFYYWADWYFGEGGPEVFIANNCPETRCEIKYIENMNRSEEADEDYDALLFHIRNFGDTQGNDEVIPDQTKRRPEQIYVVMMYESPVYTFQDLTLPKYQNLWNWSMSYRYEADFPNPLWWISERPLDPPKLFPWTKKRPMLTGQRLQYLREHSRFTDEEWAAKNGTVAWLCSHCRTYSAREYYVQELIKHVDIAVFGRCGEEFPVDWVSSFVTCTKCYEDLSKKYKFYLAFENNICDGYITEKFWQAMGADMIPIVIGGANYAQVAPPGSYIDVEDFTSPQELGEYLNYLANNKEEYENHFWWKDVYYFNAPSPFQAGICGVCDQLHKNDNPETAWPPKNVEMASEWTSNDCYFPRNHGYPPSWKVNVADLKDQDDEELFFPPGQSPQIRKIPPPPSKRRTKRHLETDHESLYFPPEDQSSFENAGRSGRKRRNDNPNRRMNMYRGKKKI